jgi:hypothetical protein
MPEVVLFVEDFAHQQVIGALLNRLAQEHGIQFRLDWRNARHGHGAVARELGDFVRDLKQQGGPLTDLIIVATDANCQGLNERIRELRDREAPAPLIPRRPRSTCRALAVARWCRIPGRVRPRVRRTGPECSRDRCKLLLIEAIYVAGVTPSLGGIEFAEDIIHHMDIDRAAQADRSFQRFIEDLRAALRGLTP